MHKDGIKYQNTKNYHVTLVETVRENKAGNIKRQLNSSKVARGLYAKIGNPSYKIFNNLIKSNIFSNCQVTL